VISRRAPRRAVVLPLIATSAWGSPRSTTEITGRCLGASAISRAMDAGAIHDAMIVEMPMEAPEIIKANPGKFSAVVGGGTNGRLRSSFGSQG